MALGDTRKKEYCKSLLAWVKGMGELADQVASLDKVYYSNTFNTGIVQADLDQFDILLVNFTLGVTLVNQIMKLMTSQAVTTGDYAATVAKLKHYVA